jgi:hypothetical protein
VLKNKGEKMPIKLNKFILAIFLLVGLALRLRFSRKIYLLPPLYDTASRLLALEDHILFFLRL